MRLDGRFGRFGGTYVPEILVPALEQLEAAFPTRRTMPDFSPSSPNCLPIMPGARRADPLPQSAGQYHLKREDLLNGGAHKTNQVLPRAACKAMGRTG